MSKREIAQYRIFISGVDTIVGHSLVEQLRNDHINEKNPHIIYGNNILVLFIFRNQSSKQTKPSTKWSFKDRGCKAQMNCLI